MGATCGAPGDCCSGICSSGRCAAIPADGTGYTCTTLGNACGAPGDCCDSTAACCNVNTGVAQDVECSATEHTCDNGGACNPPGNICGASTDVNASQNCCDGKKDVCKPDAKGILRCFGGKSTSCPAGWDASDPSCCIHSGQVCQFRDQCCGEAPCVPGQDGVLRCTLACTTSGSACTGPQDQSCCAGTTCVSTGGGSFACLPPGCSDPSCGACSAVGTVCDADGDCCSGRCEEGTCAVSCVPSAGVCTADGDCCAGMSCIFAPGATYGATTYMPCTGQEADGCYCQNFQ